MNNCSVYNFNDPVEFLAFSFKTIKDKNSQFSLRAWSKKLGFKSPNIISMVLRNERALRPNVALQIGDHLGLSTEESRYFELLCLFKNAKTQSEKKVIVKLLTKNLPKNEEFTNLALDEFRFIADWYNIAILEMIDLKTFKSDPTWIADKLGEDLTVSEVKNAIERLKRLKLITTDLQGNLKRIKTDIVSTSFDIPHDAIRQYHKQMISLALKALESQPVNKREISSNTFNIQASKIKDAKALIRNFQAEMAKIIGTKNGDQTYQLNVQFFALTD